MADLLIGKQKMHLNLVISFVEESNNGAPSHQFSICEKLIRDWRRNNKKKS